MKTLSVLFSSNGVQYRTDIKEGQPFSLSAATPDQSNVAPQTQAAEIASIPSPIAATTTPAQELAPGTSIWLLQRLSVTTKTGVTGILPGSRVTVAKDNGPTVTVTDGNHTFEVERTQLTTDPREAEGAAAADYASQAAVGAANKESRRELTEQNNKYWAQRESEKDEQKPTQQHAKTLASEAERLAGQVLYTTNEGLVLWCYITRAGSDRGRLSRSAGNKVKVLLTGYPNQAAMADGDSVQVWAYEAGVAEMSDGSHMHQYAFQSKIPTGVDLP